MHQEGAVRHAEDLYAIEFLDGCDHLLAVLRVADIDGNVAHHLFLACGYQIDGADVAADRTDGGSDPAQHANAILHLDTQGDAVAGTRGAVGGGISCGMEVTPL